MEQNNVDNDLPKVTGNGNFESLDSKAHPM